MKILLFYTCNQGYLSGFFTEIAERLSKEGHEVFNFSLKTSNAVFDHQGVRFQIVKKGGYLRTYWQIFKIINQIKPDVILSNFGYVNPALLFGRMLGVKKNLVWFHSLNEQTDATPRNIFIKKQFLKLSSLVIANSELTKAQLHQTFRVSKAKLLAIPFWTNIQDCEDTTPTPKEIKSTPNGLRIGCPGRLVKHKNQSLVIEALSKLAKAGYSNAQLYIAGRGEERPVLETLAKLQDVSNQVFFLNHLSHDEMIGFYKTMDVVVLPSLHEAFGLVFIEAIALGTPTMVSENFGALTFVDSEKYDLEKFTFNPESVDSLVEKLLPYFNKSGLSNAFFEKLYYENFDKEIIYDILRNILTS